MGRGQTQPVTRLSRGLAAAIRVQMARRGMDQKGLAASTGLSPNYVSKRLGLKLVWSVHDVDVIARALGTEPEVLMAEASREARNLAD